MGTIQKKMKLTHQRSKAFEEKQKFLKMRLNCLDRKALTTRTNKALTNSWQRKVIWMTLTQMRFVTRLAGCTIDNSLMKTSARLGSSKRLSLKMVNSIQTTQGIENSDGKIWTMTKS